jgi:hypothetical protein
MLFKNDEKMKYLRCIIDMIVEYVVQHFYLYIKMINKGYIPAVTLWFYIYESLWVGIEVCYGHGFCYLLESV